MLIKYDRSAIIVTEIKLAVAATTLYSYEGRIAVYGFIIFLLAHFRLNDRGNVVVVMGKESAVIRQFESESCENILVG